MSGFLHLFVCLLLFLTLEVTMIVESMSTSVGNASFPYRVTKEYDIVYPGTRDSEENVNESATQRTSSLNGVTTSTVESVTNCGSYLSGLNLSNISMGVSGCPYNNTSGSGMEDTRKMEHPSTHYSLLFASVAATLSAVIFLFGILGNMLVVVVIVRTHSMHTTTNCYLLSLAVADSLVLLSATLPAIPEPFFRVDEWPYGRVMCSLLIFLQYLGVNCSSLSITAFTIERYIAICHPMKAQTMCTVSRAKRIIFVIWVFTILYCSPWLGLTELHKVPLPNNEYLIKCHFRLARSSYLVWYMIDLILYYVIPLIIATVLYLLIGRILYLSRALRKSDHASQGRSPKKMEKRRADSRVQVVRMLVVVVVAFASLWMPYRVMVVYNSFAQQKYMDLWFLLFARTMIYVNCAINPILYNIMSVKFKRAFRNHLTCWFRRNSTPSQNYSEVPTDMWGTKRATLSQKQKFLPGGGNRRQNTANNYTTQSQLSKQHRNSQHQQQQQKQQQVRSSVDNTSISSRGSKHFGLSHQQTAEQAV